MWHCFVPIIVLFHLLEGNSLLIYRFLDDAAHQALDDNVNVYIGVQLLLVLSEISQTASYPLCSSVFQLLHFCIGVVPMVSSHSQRLAPKLNKPILLNDLNDFQNCLDLLQLVYVSLCFFIIAMWWKRREFHTPSNPTFFPFSPPFSHFSVFFCKQCPSLPMQFSNWVWCAFFSSQRIFCIALDSPLPFPSPTLSISPSRNNHHMHSPSGYFTSGSLPLLRTTSSHTSSASSRPSSSASLATVNFFSTVIFFPPFSRSFTVRLLLPYLLRVTWKWSPGTRLWPPIFPSIVQMKLPYPWMCCYPHSLTGIWTPFRWAAIVFVLCFPVSTPSTLLSA